jgi:glycine/D-amino acid oxidase-like deaminating enzyme
MTRLQPVHIAPTRSLWLQEALALEPDAERVDPLAGSHRADVCIVGGGYTGLWTALRIKELDPSVDVMLLEADICGGGASGRNGGLALGWWAKLDTLIQVCGEDEGLRLAKAASAAVSEIGEFCRQHGIDAHFVQAGLLRTATTPLHADAFEASVRAVEARGLDVYQRLTPEEVQARAGSPVYVAGVLDKTAATVQPALLARGLRRVALAKGVRIFEKTPATELHQGNPPVVRTPRAAVAAEKVVLATNAWTDSFHEIRRSLIVVSSDMVATAPISDRLRQIGWTGREAIADARLMVHYHQTTNDGRIAIGRGSGALAYLGRVTPTFNGSHRRAETVVHGLHFLYPMLTDVPITHEWAGPIDRSRSGTLVFGKLGGNPRILYGVGYSGTGVAPSLLGGRILASTALDRTDEWATTRLNQGWLLLYPPEPVRFFGGLMVRSVAFRKEEGEQRGVAPSRLVRRIASLAYPKLP